MDPGTHPDRHGFLHTEECNTKWRAYVKCYDEYPFLRTFFDICGNEYEALRLCFKKERQEKKRKNHALAAKRRGQLVDNIVNQKLSEDTQQ